MGVILILVFSVQLRLPIQATANELGLVLPVITGHDHVLAIFAAADRFDKKCCIRQKSEGAPRSGDSRGISIA